MTRIKMNCLGHTKKIFALSLVAQSLMAAAPAWSQSSGADGELVYQGDELETIIVTASKREQRLIDVPMAISTLSGKELLSRGVDTIQDLSFSVPGLTMREDGPGSYQIFLRGVANAFGGNALTSVYQDEVPMVLTGFDVLPTRTLDLNRVEVLKGPQGTLYGQGAVGGAVRYITNDPELNVTSGSIEGEVISVADGDTGTNFVGVANLPLIENTLAVRLVANFKEGGGWQDQPEANIEDGNGEDLTNVRLKVLWQPTDSLELLGTYVSYDAEYQLGQGYERPDRTVFVAIDPAKQLIPKIWDYDLFNITASYDFGGVELTSSTSYTEMYHQYPFAYRGGEDTVYGGVLAGNDDRYNPGEQFSQEIRLSSNTDSLFQWTVGAFYRDMERSLEAFFEYDYAGFLVTDQYFFSSNTVESTSVFADASYQITDTLNIGAGVRYFDETGSQIDGAGADATFQEAENDSVDPRVYLTWAVNDNTNIYASVAKGFRSGGFNSAGLPPFEPESLISYELGAKSTLLDGRLYVDVAAYATDYTDMLRRGLVFLGGDLGFQSLTSNVGEAEIVGLEASFNWKITDALTLAGSGTLIDAEITEINAQDAANVVGDPIDYVPETSFNVNATYNFNWAADMPGFFSLNYSYRDELPYVDLTSFPAENTPQFSDKIGLVDARLGFTRGNFGIQFYVQNLTDENEYIDPYHDWENANRTRPRTVGVKVNVDF